MGLARPQNSACSPRCGCWLVYNACCPSWPLALKFLINKFGNRVYECRAGLELCILAQASFGLIATLPSPCSWVWCRDYSSAHHIQFSLNNRSSSYDVRFPSVCCEYVLLSLVNKEAASAYSRAE